MKNKADHSEEQRMWQSLKSGGDTGFLQFYDHFYQDLYGYGFRLSKDSELTKDALQELFLEIWQNRHRQGEVLFVRAYLFTSLRRKLLKSLNLKEIPTEAFSEHDCEQSPSQEHLIADAESRSLALAKLNQALDSLTKRQREIIHLKFFEMLSYEEIAQITNLQYQSVVNHAHEAIKALRLLAKGLFSLFGLLLFGKASI